MIFVTLGTNDKSFIRLVQKIEELIISGVIEEKVVVQAGFTQYKSEHMEIFDLIPVEEFSHLMKECSLLITHGGVGSIITGLKNNKKVIAVPRLKEFGEHVNDHQLQIIENFSDSGYILGAYSVDEVERVLGEVENFIPNTYISNTCNMIDLVRNKIES